MAVCGLNFAALILYANMVKTHQYFIEYSPEIRESIATDLVAKYASNCKIALDKDDFCMLMDDGVGKVSITEMEGDSIETIFGCLARHISLGSTVILMINAKESLSFPISDMAFISQVGEMLPSYTDLIWGVGVNKAITSQFQFVIIAKALK